MYAVGKSKLWSIYLEKSESNQPISWSKDRKQRNANKRGIDFVSQMHL